MQNFSSWELETEMAPEFVGQEENLVNFCI